MSRFDPERISRPAPAAGAELARRPAPSGMLGRGRDRGEGRMPEDAVAESLERLAERVGDPAPLVYGRLFERHPETEALFLMDRGGHVRGQMLAMAFEVLLDPGRGGRLSGLLGTERMNHVNIGVPPEVFDGFFALLMGAVRDALGLEWTPAMEAAWRVRVAALGDEAHA